MTAKEYLNQAYRLNETINSNLRQIERVRDMATNITASISERVSGTPKEGGKARTIDKIVDLQLKINAETDKLVDLLAEIKAAIDSVSDADEKLLLTLRYVEFMKWEEIMDEMHFSETQVHRKHRTALNNFVIPKSWQ